MTLTIDDKNEITEENYKHLTCAKLRIGELAMLRGGNSRIEGFTGEDDQGQVVLDPIATIEIPGGEESQDSADASTIGIDDSETGTSSEATIQFAGDTEVTSPGNNNSADAEAGSVDAHQVTGSHDE